MQSAGDGGDGDGGNGGDASGGSGSSLSYWQPSLFSQSGSLSTTPSPTSPGLEHDDRTGNKSCLFPDNRTEQTCTEITGETGQTGACTAGCGGNGLTVRNKCPGNTYCCVPQDFPCEGSTDMSLS